MENSDQIEGHAGNVLKASIETLLSHHSYVKDMLFDEDFTRRKYLFDDEDYEFDVISDLSSGERILAMIALNIWDESVSVSLYEIIHTLDIRNFHNLIKAMDILRGTAYSHMYHPISFSEQFAAFPTILE